MRARTLLPHTIPPRAVLTAELAAGGPVEALPLAGRLLVWAPLAAILAGALFLRLYRLDGFVTFYPDSYAQLRSVENLLSANVATSYYPPGVAVFLAPFFAFLPDTLLTMQVAIAVAGVALIVLAYVLCERTTGDRRAALFFAAAVALGSTFVFHSRVALFDVINTLLIALSIFLAPFVARRGLVACVLYGILVFATITVRYTNPVVLPALFLASLNVGSTPLSVRRVVNHLRSRAVVTVGMVVVALYAAYLAAASENLGRFANPQGGGIFDFNTYAVRLGQYWLGSLTGYGERWHWPEAAVALPVLAFAIVGARHLWQTNRSLLMPVVYLLIVWAPVHSVYAVFWGRYAMPALFFSLLLAAVGLSVTLHWLGSLPHSWRRLGLVFLLALAVALFIGQHLAQDIATARQMRDAPAYKSEAAYEEIRTVLRGIDGDGAVLLSSQILAVDKANPEMTSYDLIRHTWNYAINADSIDRLLTYVRARQADGKTIYYHYTAYEDMRSRLHRYELGFDAYFVALQREFSLRELVRASERPQRLYLLEPRARAE